MKIHTLTVCDINEIERELILNSLIGEGDFSEIVAYQDDEESCFELRDWGLGNSDRARFARAMAVYVWDTIGRLIPVKVSVEGQDFEFFDKHEMMKMMTT